MFEIFSKSFCHLLVFTKNYLSSCVFTFMKYYSPTAPEMIPNSVWGIIFESGSIRRLYRAAENLYFTYSLFEGVFRVFLVRFCVTQYCHVKKSLISGSFANWTVLHEFLWKTQWQMYLFAADMVPGKWTPTRGPTIKGFPYIALQICVNHLSEYFAHEKLCRPDSWGGSLPFISQILDLIF